MNAGIPKVGDRTERGLVLAVDHRPDQGAHTYAVTTVNPQGGTLTAFQDYGYLYVSSIGHSPGEIQQAEHDRQVALAAQERKAQATRDAIMRQAELDLFRGQPVPTDRVGEYWQVVNARLDAAGLKGTRADVPVRIAHETNYAGAPTTTRVAIDATANQGATMGLWDKIKGGLGAVGTLVGGAVGGPAGAALLGGVGAALAGSGTRNLAPQGPQANLWQDPTKPGRYQTIVGKIPGVQPYESTAVPPMPTLQAGLPIKGIATVASKIGRVAGTALAAKEGIDLARTLMPGGGKGIMSGVRPDTVRQEVRRCPQGYVLAVDGNCYPRQMLPRSWRMHQPEPKPVVSRSDQKAIRKADSAKKRLVKITRAAGAHASMSKPKPCGCGPGKRKK